MGFFIRSVCLCWVLKVFLVDLHEWTGTHIHMWHVPFMQYTSWGIHSSSGAPHNLITSWVIASFLWQINRWIGHVFVYWSSHCGTVKIYKDKYLCCLVHWWFCGSVIRLCDAAVAVVTHMICRKKTQIFIFPLTCVLRVKHKMIAMPWEFLCIISPRCDNSDTIEAFWRGRLSIEESLFVFVNRMSLSECVLCVRVSCDCARVWGVE